MTAKEEVNIKSDARIAEKSFLEKLADMSPALLYLFDVIDRRNIYINARSQELLGYSPESILTMGTDFFTQALHPDDRSRFSEHFGKLQAAGEGDSVEIEYRMRHLDGSWRWFSSRDTVFNRTPEGQVRQVLGTAQDITDRKQTEEALRENERRFQAFMNYSPTAAWMVNREGQVLYLNSTYFQMFQFDQTDAIGKNLLDIYPEEFANQFIENNNQVIRTEQAVQKIEYAPRVNGDIGTFLVCKFPIKSIYEELIIGGVAFDITEHKLAESALKESEERFRKMFECSPLGISFIDLNGKFIQANQTYCEMVGYSEQELCQMTFAEITHPEDVEIDINYTLRLIRREISSYQIEKRYQAKNGQIVWVNLTSTAIFDRQGKFLYGFAMVENISDRKREEQRKAARYAVTRVLAQTKTLAEALPVVLQSLCETLGWQLGLIWQVDERENALHYLDNWHSKNIKAEEFLQIKKVSFFTFGVGLPGIVWASKSPYWIEDISEYRNFARAEMATKAGLRSALGFPIQVGNEILGVIECFSDRVQPPDEDLLLMMQIMGNQIGQFMQQKQTEKALQESQEIFENFMKYSPIAAFIKDETGRYIYANAGIEQVYQRQPTDLIGKTDLELLPVEIAQQFRARDLTVLNNCEPLQTLEKIPNQDGEHYYMSIEFPFRNASGKQLLAGVKIDVSDRVRTEEALRQREQELASIADAVPVLMSFIDSQLRYRFNNRCYEEWFGISATELRGKYLWEVIGESAYETIRHYVEQALSGQLVTFESQVPYQNAGIRYVSISYIPQFDREGKVAGFVALVNDLTDRVLAQEAIQQSDERFRLAARAVSGVVYDWDMQNYTVYRSEGLYELIGIHPQEVPERREWWLEIIHPDDRDRVEQMLSSMLVSERDRYESEYRILHEDGRWIDVWDRGYLIRDRNKEVIRLVGSTVDISDRKRVEEALKNREKRFSTLFNGMKDWVLVYQLNPDNRPEKFIEVNEQACKKLGYSREELFSMSVVDIIDLLAIDPIASLQRLLLEKHIVVESVHRRKDGRSIPVEVSATLFTLNGLPTVQAICRDITNRKQAEKEKEQLLERERTAREEAEDANRIKDEFLAVLSHELRSPLNPILGWTSLLRKHQLDAQTTDRALETIERNAKLQTQLIEDLLDVSRILRGKMTLNVAAVNLTETIEAALETVQLAAQAKRIQIRTSFSANSGRVYGDAARLQQVIWNLLTNAVKFTPAGGRIEVSLQPDENQVKLIVSDTGKGISREFLPHVFDYFRQEDGKITRKFGGLGLGLAIVRHITELHGGTVRVESPGEGLGAMFTVSLPLLKDEGEEIIEDAKVDFLSASARKFPLLGVHILIVDDLPDVRELMEVVLKQTGAEVRVAASAIEALVMFDREPPDIIISDIGMPEMDGYMLIRQIRNMPPEKGSQIPAIALTAYAGEFDRQQAIDAGFQQHISKPVAPDELVQVILNLVSANRSMPI